MKWIIVSICCILAVEILLRSGLTALAGHMGAVLGRILHVLANRRISDHWKEKILPAYAFMIFAGSFRLLATLLLAFSPFAAVIYLAAPLELDSFMFSPSVLAGETAVALVYGTARRRHA
ncbi:MAG: hypothetical protein ACLFNS_05245 [Desulfobacterales bacterium]